MYDFKQLTGSSKYRGWKYWQHGEYLVGKVQSFPQNSKNKQYNDIVVEVIEVGFPGTTISPKDRFTVSACASIQNAIDSGLEEDDVIKIIYKGKTTVKKGPYAGSDTHVVETFVAKKETHTSEEGKEDSGLL